MRLLMVGARADRTLRKPLSFARVRKLSDTPRRRRANGFTFFKPALHRSHQWVRRDAPLTAGESTGTLMGGHWDRCSCPSMDGRRKDLRSRASGPTALEIKDRCPPMRVFHSVVCPWRRPEVSKGESEECRPRSDLDRGHAMRAFTAGIRMRQSQR